MKGKTVVFVIVAALLFSVCPSPRGEAKTARIPEGEMEPAVWGRVYPLEYGMWKRTGEPEPPGKSRY